MIDSVKNKQDLGELEELSYLQGKIKPMNLGKKFVKQGFHYDAQELLNQLKKQLMKLD